jgi:hypothetical protein
LGHGLTHDAFAPHLKIGRGFRLQLDRIGYGTWLGYKKMPIDVARSAVDLLFDYSGNERDLNITHFGGEPTLNFPAIQFVTEYSERKASLLGKSVHYNILAKSLNN